LKEIQAQTSAVRTAVEEQREKLDKTTTEVDAVVKEMKEGEIKTREELTAIREEVNNVRDMLPKVCSDRSRNYSRLILSSLLYIQMIDKSKEAHNQSLMELQQEIKSLRTLMLSRGGSMTPTGVSTPVLPGKPSIPAWQLAGASHITSSAANVIPGSPTASLVASPIAFSSATTLGKGKEVDGSMPQRTEDPPS
jgi:peroxin-14